MVKLKTKEEAQRFAWESDLATTLREVLVSSASLVESVREEIPSARACAGSRNNTINLNIDDKKRKSP